MYLKEINRLQGKCWLNPCGFFCFILFVCSFCLFCFVLLFFFSKLEKCTWWHFYIRFSLSDDGHVKIFYRMSSSISRDRIERKMQIFLLYLLLLIFWVFNRELIILYPNNVISKYLGLQLMLFEISKHLGRTCVTHILVNVGQTTRNQNI